MLQLKPLPLPEARGVRVGQSVTLQARVQHPTRANRLLVSHRKGERWTVESFRVGETELLAQPAPAEIFNAAAFATPFGAPPIEPGAAIVLVVRRHRGYRPKRDRRRRKPKRQSNGWLNALVLCTVHRQLSLPHVS